MNPWDRIRAAYADIQDRVAQAGGTDVEILPVTKGFGIDALFAARRLGATAVGENYVQELVTKLASATDSAPNASELDVPAVDFIGQLQTNKVKFLAGRVRRYSSVDRSSLAEMIAKRDPGAEVLIQVNPYGNQEHGGKGGCPVADLDALVDLARACGLAVAGLMTVGPTTGGAEAARPGFAMVRSEVDRLGLDVCSMGMSGDLEAAVQEGSTQVRVGTLLFGDRKAGVR